MPAALRIIEEETERFVAELHYRAARPTICQLQQEWQMPKEAELERLFHKLPQLSDRAATRFDTRSTDWWARSCILRSSRCARNPAAAYPPTCSTPSRHCSA